MSDFACRDEERPVIRTGSDPQNLKPPEALVNRIICPGCRLGMPKRHTLTAHGYYNATPECWSVYTEVLASEYSNGVLFGQVHQLTVDT